MALAVVVVVVCLLYAASSYPGRRAAEPAPAPHHVQATKPTPYLPFDMPTGPTNKKVFAHYVPWFPISLDNVAYQNDYYTTQYINPMGEGGVHAAYGGLMRDRPLPRNPINDPNWLDIDVATEIGQAKSIGLDGFAVDIVLPPAQNAVTARLLTQADKAGDFSIQLTPDMSGQLGTLSPADFASDFAPFLKMPGAQRLNDGRVVLGAFFAERVGAAWWADALNRLRTTYNVDVAFVPTFLDANANMGAFAPISYGLSEWGGRDPAAVDPSNTAAGSPAELVGRAHSFGKIWMQPIAFQDNRPKDAAYAESDNGLTNRNAWAIATNENAEWANLVTWNDYAETTAVAPSVKHGWGLLDMDAYRVAVFKYGDAPPVLRETMYVTHRQQPFAAMPSFKETRLMANIGLTPPRDTVEVESFATAPSTVVGEIGGQSHDCQVPAGVGLCTFPATAGTVKVSLRRDDADRVVVTSPAPITNAPYVQDLQYVVAGGLR